MSDKQEEPTFSILPHPAKHNEPPQPGGGLTSKPEIEALNAKGGPHILSDEVKNSLEQPLSREELKKRQEELNK